MMLRYLQTAIVSTLLIHTAYCNGGLYGAPPQVETPLHVPADEPDSIEVCLTKAPDVVSHLMGQGYRLSFRCISEDLTNISSELYFTKEKVTNEISTVKEVK